ncbi:MAG TPA: hypothetical protein EYO58_05925 [Flavobacteriales bacterium]|nr:hypothetical protein [Flavobacteriales bacterium]
MKQLYTVLLRTIVLACLATLFTQPAFSASTPGFVTVFPEYLRIETKATMVFTYTAGSSGLNIGDEIQLHDPMFHGMRWSKWGELSIWKELCNPLSGGPDGISSFGLVTASTDSPGVGLTIERTNCENKNTYCFGTLHDEAWTRVIVESGALVEGDTINITVGDQSENPDCGLQVGPRAYPNVWWPAYEIADGISTELEAPVIHINPKSIATKLLVIVPSQAVVGEPFAVKLSALDDWGNAVPYTDLQTTLNFDAAGSGSGQSYDFQTSSVGWHDLTVTINDEGVHWLTVDSQLGTVYSNPVEVMNVAPERSIYWGDIHVHHGYSWYDIDGILHDINQSYARDVVGLDVSCESEKALPVEAHSLELWEELTQTCAELSVEGSFLVLQGFEWMGAWAVEAPNPDPGHHNVYYDSCDGPLGSHEFTNSVQDKDGLWDYARSVREEFGIDAITIPHAMPYTSYYYDSYDNDIQKVAEIFSGWGDSTDGRSKEGYGGIDDMFQHDVRMGFMASSDNHDGWMGNPYYLTDHNGTPGGGYVAFVAEALNRAAVFDSLKTRHTYATTANRGIVHFESIDSEKTIDMGSEYLAKQ